ncbi:MAG: efflux RND transporter periplasmic adaptor subunit [Rikenellaceae bacterium]
MANFLVIPTLCLTITLCAGCKNKTKKGDMPPLRVESSIATTRTLSDPIWFSSSIEAISSVTIEPRVDGYLSKILFSGGDRVRRGQLLFEIDPSQIETTLLAAQASLESARATLTQSHNNYQRAIPLARTNAISQSSLDEYRASYLAAEASVKSAEQSLRNAELNLSYASIKAPIDGVIADTPANSGDYVGPATKFTTLTTITNIDSITVSLPIPTRRYLQYRKATENQDLLSEITLILADSSRYPILGEYDYTEQSIGDNSASVVIVAKFPNPNYTLKNGMFARVRASIGGPVERVMIPQKAVTQMQGMSSVWVIGEDSTATFRRVELGPTFGDEWQVRSGLISGERVTTSGQLKLHEGSKISF